MVGEQGGCWGLTGEGGISDWTSFAQNQAIMAARHPAHLFELCLCCQACIWCCLVRMVLPHQLSERLLHLWEGWGVRDAGTCFGAKFVAVCTTNLLRKCEMLLLLLLLMKARRNQLHTGCMQQGTEPLESRNSCADMLL